jgi:hypothetical protein
MSLVRRGDRAASLAALQAAAAANPNHYLGFLCRLV